MKTQEILAKHSVLYKTAPETIQDAFPFGNGRFGGMLWKPGEWEWVIGKLDVEVDEGRNYAEECSPRNVLRNFKHLHFAPEAKWMEAAEKKDERILNECRLHVSKALRKTFGDNTTGLISSDSKGQWRKVNLVPGYLKVDFGEETACREHLLDLWNGRIQTDCVRNKSPFRMITAVDSARDVFVIDFQAVSGGLPPAIVTLARPRHTLYTRYTPQFRATDTLLELEFETENHFRYAVCVRIEGAEFDPDGASDHAGAKIVRVSRPVVRLYVSCTTCMESPDVAGAARAQVVTADGDVILERGAEFWHRFWEQSGVAFDDDFFENVYYLQQYMFNCSNGRGMKNLWKACGLYGLWTDTDDTPWTNRPYQDANIQMAYQHVFSSNHLEQFEPFVQMMTNQLPDAKQIAKTVFGIEGAVFDLPFMCSTPWYCGLLWDYYLYSQDIAYLRERAYPILREAGRFFRSFLKRNADGIYRIFPSSIPERYLSKQKSRDPHLRSFFEISENPAIDLAFVRRFMQIMVEACAILDCDRDMAEFFKTALPFLADYPVAKGEHGRVIIDSEDWGTVDYCLHPNPIAAIYPTRGIHFSDPPDRVRLGQATVRAVRDHSANQYMFNMPWLAAGAAGMGLGDEAEEILSRRIVDFYLDPSGMMGREINRMTPFSSKFAYGPKPGNPCLLETGCGYIAAINEMLIQERDGAVFLFPALPSKWNYAEFNNLRIPGALVVSARYENGGVAAAVFRGETNKTIRVRNPWQGEIKVSGGDCARDIRCGEYIELLIKPGVEMRLQPKEPASSTSGRREAAHKPKTKTTLQGNHIHIGKDERTRIQEAVEEFYFPLMRTPNGPALFGQSRYGYVMDIPQDIVYKFDFGGMVGAEYSRFYNQPRYPDVAFTPLAADHKYDDSFRYGWFDNTGIVAVTTDSGEILTSTALEGQSANIFQLKLTPGRYQFLLLHGGKSGETVNIGIPVAGVTAHFVSPARVGMDGWGIRIKRFQPFFVTISPDNGSRWRIYAMLIKQV